MFEATTQTNQKARANPAAGALSILIHVLIAAILIAVLWKENIIADDAPDVEVTFFSAAPPPPPPPPAVKKKKKKKKEKKEEEPTPPQEPELVQPEEIPEDIPETEDAEEEDEEVSDAGVEGGVEGGVAGGVVNNSPHNFGLGESKGLCTKKPPARYPEMAKEMNIEGTVRVRLLIGVDGKIVKAKDPLCKRWASASKKDRRRFWHPRLCVQATSGPDALVYETLTAWGTSRWRPWKSGNVNTNYYANVEVNYQLK